jgi:hypothetical protein
MRSQISATTWDQIKTAHASGLGLREIARNMGIPTGTVLARASREQWARHIEAAKSLAKPLESEIVPACDAAALTMRERAERHVKSMAGITERVLPHLEKMEPGEILSSARNLERWDYVARRNHGLDNQPASHGPVTLNILADNAAVQVLSPT